MRLISRRSLASKTATSPELALETSTLAPSGVNFRRIGKVGESSVAITSSDLASTTLTVLPRRLLTHTCEPSGDTSMPSASGPVDTWPRRSPFSRSITVIECDPMLATNARVASGESAAMWLTLASVPMARSTSPFPTWTTSSICSASAVTTTRSPSGRNTMPCGRRYFSRSIIFVSVPVVRSMTLRVWPG